MALWDPNTGPSPLDLSGFDDPPRKSGKGKGKGSPSTNAPPQGIGWSVEYHSGSDTAEPSPDEREPVDVGTAKPIEDAFGMWAGGSSVRAVRDRQRPKKAPAARPTGRPGARGGDQPLSPLGRALVGAVAGGVVARAFEVPGGWATGVVAGGCVGYFIFGEFQWQMP